VGWLRRRLSEFADFNPERNMMTKTHSFLFAMLFAFSLGICASTGCAQEKPDGAKTADSGASDEAAEKTVANEDDPKAASEEPAPVPPEPLLIGSAAPQLDIEHWIQDGGGHFSKVTEFEADKVYVVEFWATWCGPCIASMPHIAELQHAYADRGVQVVSITKEDTETVEKFLDREVRGAKEGDEIQTYRDLTSGYCLTADPDKSSSRDYMQAAKQGGIPCAFIVGKDTRIEWIGHPMSMDEPLEQIVTDSWNRDAFAEQFAAQQAVSEITAKVSREARSGKIASAVAILDTAMSDPKLSSQKSAFGTMKFQLLASDKASADEAAAVALELLADESMDASGVNQIAWTLYQYSAAKRFHDEEVLQAAIDLSQAAVEDSGQQKAYLLDTIAHLHYALGDLETALVIQQSAVEAADAGSRSKVEPFLRQLQKVMEAKNSPPEEKAEEGSDDAEPEDEK
jgi:thiol-disulfide isomerase/thioredoxin